MSLAYDDGIVRAHLGDAATVLRTLPAESIQCCVTSPPYWGLRDYGCEGQLGLEATPEEWVAELVSVFREVRRVLRADGTLWLNVGDCYASLVTAGLKPKDLVGLPWMLAFALRADGWYLRSDIVWSKPNPMPESVTDRPTKAHEYLFLLSKRSTYYYDAEAIREPDRGTDHARQVVEPIDSSGGFLSEHAGIRTSEGRNGLGRNKRSVWTIATAPYPDAHFATFPPALVKPCILAGTSARGCCPECGAPWMRNVEVAYDPVGRTTNGPRSVTNRGTTAGFARRLEKRTTSIGWTSGCGHNLVPVPATVLDPFAGSGTTLAVAKSLDRKAIGIELSPAYMALLRQRCARAHAQIALPLATEGVS